MSADHDESVEVRISARKLDGAGILLALQRRDDESWGRRLLVEGAFVPSSAAPGRWFDSSTLTIAGMRVRVSARRLDGGRVEFGLQQRRGDGSWGGRVLPTRRFVPASASPGRWYTSSPVALAPEAAATSETEWTLLAGGDVLMDRTEPAGVDPFAGIEPPLASGDVAVVNVEMAITDRGTPSGKEFVFRAPSSAAQRIADAGIDVANLANNHAMDYGSVGLMDTIALLEDAGVIALGAGANDVEAFRHRIVEIDGDVTVAFVGVSRIVPWGFPAGPDSPGIASDVEPERVFESVRIASSEADVVIAVVHWGIEVATCPSADQREFARMLFDAGADAVIGHHPHVLQAIEFVDGKLVAYSLGNFVWHERWGISAETGVLQIDFAGDRIAGWDFHPHLLDENGAPRPAEAGWRVDRLHELIEGNCERHEGTSPYDLEPREPASGSTAQPVEDVQEYSSQQFKELLDSVLQATALPNLVSIADGPEITGDPDTDARLRRIAEERGYRLQPVVASSNELAAVDEKLLQPEAARAFRALREAARQAGHQIVLKSGYRGFDVQRYLLFRHLKAPYTDARIYVALRVVAPPGYSRHQTGYAVDIAATGYGINDFKHSEAYAWLAADNFLQAREHGFIPSYPAGVENQGADPEPWEFVYVGVDNLTAPEDADIVGDVRSDAVPPDRGDQNPVALITPTGVPVAVVGQTDGGWLVRTPCGATASVAAGTPIGPVRVVVDPGHGGPFESGAIGPNGLAERDLNLTLSRALLSELAARGIPAATTRTGDYGVLLPVRASFADALGVEALVSIHHNGPTPGPADSPGTEVYAQSAPDGGFRFASGRLGGLLYQEITDALAGFDGIAWSRQADAGVLRVLLPDDVQSSRDGLYGGDAYGMIRSPRVPAVLVEYGYLSNASEAALFATDRYIQVAATATADAIEAYLGTDRPGTGLIERPRVFDPVLAPVLCDETPLE